jgi:hypothetical protein
MGTACDGPMIIQRHPCEANENNLQAETISLSLADMGTFLDLTNGAQASYSQNVICKGNFAANLIYM